MSNIDESRQPLLSFSRDDIEQKFLFNGGRFTQVNTALSFVLALAVSIGFFGILFPLQGSAYVDMFFEHGIIPYTIVFFTAWATAILVLKHQKLRLQRRCLEYQLVPEDVDFILNPANVDTVVEAMYQIADDPRRFMLFNRIAIALGNLRNIGRVSDVDEILRSQADVDEAAIDNSYMLVASFIWAIPVLGFIGTVLGLSKAIGKFGAVLQQPDGMGESGGLDGIKGQLYEVTGGLSMAFVTTLQALVAALAIQLLLTFIKKNEHDFLERCSRYCTENIVNRLRLLPFERDV
jgi:biopolymer transport protein ExbB/TolQ